MNKSKVFLSTGVLILILAIAFTACAPTPTPEVIEKVKEVVVTQVVEKEVEVVVETNTVTVDAGYGSVTLDYVPQRVFVDGVQGIEMLAVLGVEPVGWTTRGIEVFPSWLEVDWADSENLEFISGPNFSGIKYLPSTILER